MTDDARQRQRLGNYVDRTAQRLWNEAADWRLSDRTWDSLPDTTRQAYRTLISHLFQHTTRLVDTAPARECSYATHSGDYCHVHDSWLADDDGNCMIAKNRQHTD